MEKKWRVLVADDDSAIRALVDSVLRNGPYEMTTCADAESALVAVECEEPFDIIICDFMLPGISGIDFVERLRAMPGYPHTPVLMISGHTNYSMDDRAKAAGADAFLNKPFTVSQLRMAVKELLPQNRA